MKYAKEHNERWNAHHPAQDHSCDKAKKQCDDALRDFYKRLIKAQRPIPQDIQKIINEEWANL